MAKSTKKTTVRTNTNIDTTPGTVANLKDIAKSICIVGVSDDIMVRFAPQIVRVAARIGTIANNVEKAIILEATKDEREAKKAERAAKCRARLEAQLAAVQAKLAKLDS